MYCLRDISGGSNGKTRMYAHLVSPSLSSVQIQHSQHPFLNKMRNEIQNVNISEGANSGDLSILIWLVKHDVIEPC